MSLFAIVHAHCSSFLPGHIKNEFVGILQTPMNNIYVPICAIFVPLVVPLAPGGSSNENGSKNIKNDTPIAVIITTVHNDISIHSSVVLETKAITYSAWPRHGKQGFSSATS